MYSPLARISPIQDYRNSNAGLYKLKIQAVYQTPRLFSVLCTTFEMSSGFHLAVCKSSHFTFTSKFSPRDCPIEPILALARLALGL
jgi:hypothetical protein